MAYQACPSGRPRPNTTMDAGVHTPLLDFFRREEVARDIRLLAAQGALAPRAQEQLALLLVLLDDRDPEIARAAGATLDAIPRDALAAFLARPDVPAAMRRFFAERGVNPAATPVAEAIAPLIDVGQAQAAEDRDQGDDTAVQRIAAMTVAQRIVLAMRGTREERTILVRDPNKIVAVAVLSSPKLADAEVEHIARMASVPEDILRIIATTRAWIKNYAVVAALTRNPKTPVALSMNLLSRLTDTDLRLLSTDRNVPDVLRVTARTKLLGGR